MKRKAMGMAADLSRTTLDRRAVAGLLRAVREDLHHPGDIRVELMESMRPPAQRRQSHDGGGS